MNYNEYLDRVMDHAKPLPFNDDLHHMCLGLTSEAGEIADAIKALMIYGKPLDVANIGEEMGDGMWFAGGLARLLQLDFDELVHVADAPMRAATRDRLCTYSAWTCDAAAALHIRVAAFTDEGVAIQLPTMAAEIIRYLKNLRRIGEVFGLSLEKAALGNIAKLAYRYGGGFNAEKGLTRDKAGERRVIAEALGLQEAVAA